MYRFTVRQQLTLVKQVEVLVAGQFEILWSINQQERISRKGAKAQSQSTQRTPINQGFAFFLCVTSAFAGNSLFLLLISN
jgi:hypothetical protein